jgi:endopolyphosphatase
VAIFAEYHDTRYFPILKLAITGIESFSDSGPNSITYEFSWWVHFPSTYSFHWLIPLSRRIWSSFIPFPSYQVFQRGAYYSVEVIPDAVAVVALNTMYFYDSNKGLISVDVKRAVCLTCRPIAVGGCQYTDPEDPGNLEFDWLEVQLNSFRNRNMQVSLDDCTE